MKLKKDVRQNEAVIAFSLVNETNQNLRNRLRRTIEKFGMSYSGTSLFSGMITEEKLQELSNAFLEIVSQDNSEAALANLEVWYCGNQHFSLIEDEVA